MILDNNLHCIHLTCISKHICTRSHQTLSFNFLLEEVKRDCIILKKSISLKGDFVWKFCIFWASHMSSKLCCPLHYHLQTIPLLYYSEFSEPLSVIHATYNSILVSAERGPGENGEETLPKCCQKLTCRLFVMQTKRYYACFYIVSLELLQSPLRSSQKDSLTYTYYRTQLLQCWPGPEGGRTLQQF